MTRKEAIEMLEAKLACMERETSGIDEDCNSELCDECSLNYCQGNMGEQIEVLKFAIKALKEDLYNKAFLLEKVEQAKRKNDQVFNHYNKYYTLSLENYCNDVDDILCNLIKEFNKNIKVGD